VPNSYTCSKRAQIAALACAIVQAGLGGTNAWSIEPFTLTSQPFWMLDEIRAGVSKQAIDDAPHEGAAALNLEVLGGRFEGRCEQGISLLRLLASPTVAFVGHRRPHVEWRPMPAQSRSDKCRCPVRIPLVAGTGSPIPMPSPQEVRAMPYLTSSKLPIRASKGV